MPICTRKEAAAPETLNLSIISTTFSNDKRSIWFLNRFGQFSFKIPLPLQLRWLKQWDCDVCMASNGPVGLHPSLRIPHWLFKIERRTDRLTSISLNDFSLHFKTPATQNAIIIRTTRTHAKTVNRSECLYSGKGKSIRVSLAIDWFWKFNRRTRSILPFLVQRQWSRLHQGQAWSGSSFSKCLPTSRHTPLRGSIWLFQNGDDLQISRLEIWFRWIACQRP